jgi:HK97 family phage portal protein
MTRWQLTLTYLRALLTRRATPETHRFGFTGRTTAGEYVDGERALRVSAVWACLSYLSRTVAQLPWKVYQPSAVGKQLNTTSSVAKLLSLRPNPEMTPFSFKETMVWWAASYGNAIAEIERDMAGRAVGLWPIEPWRVDIKRDRNTSRLQFEVRNEAGVPTRALQPENVFHVRGFGNGPVGLDVIAYAAESIGWARATEVFGSAYFGQAMNPSGVIKTKGKLTKDGLNALKSKVEQTFTGPKNALKTLVLDVDMDFEKLPVDPNAAQFVETRQHQVEEICRWFGVPPHKVMHLLRSTFNNIEHQSIEVVVDSITPWVIRLEEEANYRLFGANREGFYTKLEMKGLLRGAYKERQEGLQIMRRNGVISADEWRELEDMNPIGTGDGGGKHVIEANMTTLEKVGEEQEAAQTQASGGGSADDNVVDAIAWRTRQRTR